MKFAKIVSSHEWNRYTALRVVLALASIVSMLLASGANSQWW